MNKIRAAVVGATGFTGSELVRILHHHPHVDLALITSESRAGERLSDVHPFFESIVDSILHPVSEIGDHDIDLGFLALPHGVSMEYVRKLLQLDMRIIDLSGDYRLSSPIVYEKWYGKEHTYISGFDNAVYGIPELYASQIRSAELVANPGCYPTSVILAVAPLLKAGLIDPAFIIADCKSGVTGAGVKAKEVNHFSNVNDNFKAYALKSHRHSIEIEEKLQGFSPGELKVQFTPHLLPLDRGILSTIYLRPSAPGMTEERIQEAFAAHYADAPFIRMTGSSPSVKHVRGTNFCDIHATYDDRTGHIIVISAIDNLVRGAAGQAVQNMNLMFNWKEDAGLEQVPLCP